MVFIGLGAKYYCMGKTQEPALFTRFHSLRIVLLEKLLHLKTLYLASIFPKFSSRISHSKWKHTIVGLDK